MITTDLIIDELVKNGSKIRAGEKLLGLDGNFFKLSALGAGAQSRLFKYPCGD